MRRGIGRTGSMIHGADCCFTGPDAFLEAQETGMPFQRSPFVSRERGTSRREASHRGQTLRGGGRAKETGPSHPV